MDSKRINAEVKREITSDGSDTLYSTTFEAHYHSTHGARQESIHVFINSGLEYIRKHLAPIKEIKILEIGFGTGLNALLTATYAQDQAQAIYFHTIEAYPVEITEALNLNYPKTDQEISLFEQIHKSTWNDDHRLNPDFILHKTLDLFELAQFRENYNLIYFDAFAPQCQPYLWQPDFLGRLCERLSPGGVLVTYCAQGAFKRALRSVGMKVEGIPGPPGKREMTRATKL